ncbi:MAG: signal peptidase I [Clostridiales bacterium]|jgi:signal peptidase I|nr:signal peptidase I [Clostridiales bacterium]
MALNDKEKTYKSSSFSDSAVAATIENEFDIPDVGSSYVDTEDASADEINDGVTKSKWKSFLFDILFYAVLIVVCIYIIPNFVMQRTIVDGDSMKNNLLDGDHLMVEKISYRFKPLDRFDIVVFYPYGRDYEEYYVKRVIGLPGETIQIIGSEIYINGEILEEDYGKDSIDFAGRANEPITLGDDEYFVMGDNRRNSKDSRYGDVGNVSKENIGGRAIFRIWPLNRFGFIN